MAILTKQQLLDKVSNNSTRLVNYIEEVDDTLNAAGIKMYYASVLQPMSSGDRENIQSIAFYVVDEGTQDEKAVFRDELRSKNILWNQAENYVNSLIPGTFQKAFVTQVNEEQEYAIAQVYELDGATDIIGKSIFIYKDGGVATWKYLK